VVQRVATFRRAFDDQPPCVPSRVEHRESPDLAVAFMQKVLDVEAGERQVVHVVAERSHAHHDRGSVVVPLQVCGDDAARGHVCRFALRLEHERSTRIDGARVADREQQQRHRCGNPQQS
jgi:hypothetical protein